MTAIAQIIILVSAHLPSVEGVSEDVMPCMAFFALYRNIMALITLMGAFTFEGGDAYDFADGEAVIAASRKFRSKN